MSRFIRFNFKWLPPSLLKSDFSKHCIFSPLNRVLIQDALWQHGSLPQQCSTDISQAAWWCQIQYITFFIVIILAQVLKLKEYFFFEFYFTYNKYTRICIHLVFLNHDCVMYLLTWTKLNIIITYLIIEMLKLLGPFLNQILCTLINDGYAKYETQYENRYFSGLSLVN